MTAEGARVAAVFLLRPDGSALLQLRDNKPGLRHAGMWVPPGGHAEPGESIEACAFREFEEETAYRCGQLWRLGRVDSPELDHELEVFWAPFDGRQRIECREGQALEFVSWEQSSKRAMPDYLRSAWAAAREAFQKDRQEQRLDKAEPAGSASGPH